MATQRWRGDAPNVSQVQTITFGAWDAATTYKFTINSKTISGLGNVSGATNATTLAVAFLALLQASSASQEFDEITWTVPSAGVIVGTSVTAGKPFTLSATVSGGGGTFTSNTVTTASSGAKDISVPANWVSGALPVTGDDIVFDGGGDVLYNLDSQVAVTPNSITVLPSFTSNIGLPPVNQDSKANPYQEYRQTYLQYGTNGTGGTITVTINGGGGRIQIDNHNAQAVWNVVSNGRRADPNIPTVLLKSTHASTVLNLDKGDVGIAWFAGEAATLAACNIGYQNNPSGDSKLWLGNGATLTSCAITQTGGSLTINTAVTGGSAVSSFQMYGGKCITYGSGSVGQLTMDGGTFVYNLSGTLGGNTVVAGTSTLDFSQDPRAKTVTNPIKKYGSKAKILDPNKVIASLAINYQHGGDPGDDALGVGYTLTRS